MSRDFQDNAWDWFKECFPDPKWENKKERVFRFAEEAVELMQAAEMTREEVQKIVAYVYGRPPGRLHSEIGGTMLTLAVFCSVVERSLMACAEIELARVMDPLMMKKIRQKQASKEQGLVMDGSGAIGNTD